MNTTGRTSDLRGLRGVVHWVVALTALVFLTGCLNMGKLARELGKDPATVNVSVTTIYGNLKFTRTNPGTNSTVTVAPDGTVNVQRK